MAEHEARRFELAPQPIPGRERVVVARIKDLQSGLTQTIDGSQVSTENATHHAAIVIGLTSMRPGFQFVDSIHTSYFRQTVFFQDGPKVDDA
ncbi:hypothetical protein HY024_03355, partial [Candidatus Curtissbacteria bacterium]|nr:hypothetical protein [Candidatus Curtissbacteria bacterium]